MLIVLFSFMHVYLFYFCYILIIIVLLKGICLACGDDKVCAQHPLFKGGLCKECKVSVQNKALAMPMIPNYFILKEQLQLFLILDI